MNKSLAALAVAAGLVIAAKAPSLVPKAELLFAENQLTLADKARTSTEKIPHSLNADGSLRDMKSDWWCSGFFGGNLWYLYEYSKNPAMKALAEKWTAPITKEQYNTHTHDLGFMLYCSFGNGYRLTKNPEYKQVLLTGAKSLATRFDPKVGLIKSWDGFKSRDGKRYEYPVIIDNMMNLEFLFWAAKESGDKSLYNICITHADNTLKNHFRPDGSSYHVVCYGPNGEVLLRTTHQGYAQESAWARGQAWGLYGYTVMYRETKDKKYLAQAQKIADFYLSHPNLPADKIPYWDFNAPNIPNEERDASAGAITASALLELSGYTKGAKGKEYFAAAEKMLQSLSTPAYKANLGENGNFVLKHSVGHKPGNSEIDVPLVYADYYYIEGLMRYDKLKK
ncbi:glycoside hydrolase family 88 protein [Siphonobacter aquaeclarae]|jgi:unsaturated chondroitin disaccharide hydrolase|uniref:Glycosyl Hydrolase Family 88 n=1 Tax=Siphonobacter aquaeclarae TaxID=563176 RepID=A0A1G9QED5_9BACT|nr:glycoside hydrolase family 88 protein [Siphonobacter aquaeclarae]MBO9639935.1 glycoside hydrolase family 88 protein [Siphonobacter aquaeclarae]SDM09454.1 Glycosyl Hydrolase Family 88 [Siphonobacter aquaeclarae]